MSTIQVFSSSTDHHHNDWLLPAKLVGGWTLTSLTSVENLSLPTRASLLSGDDDDDDGDVDGEDDDMDADYVG